MSRRTAVAPRARLSLDRKTTEVIPVPQLRCMTVNGTRGVWVPVHPLTEIRRTR